MSSSIQPIPNANLRGRIILVSGLVFAGLILIYLLSATLPHAINSSVATTGIYSNGSTGSSTITGVKSAPNPVNAPGSTTPITDQNVAAQYIIKSLGVGMVVADPRKTAADLAGYIATTDPKATTTGNDIIQSGTNQYHVTLRYSVQATLYPQIQQYLVGYPEQHGGQLSRSHEEIQDVTSGVIDAQARLVNLQQEEGRLRDLLGKATTLTDILAVEQQLTNVQGQIEQIQAHLQSVAGQTTFYTVTIDLSPLTADSPAPTISRWDGLATLQNAWSAAVGFGQWLLTLVIWLGVFGIYIVPVVAIFLIVRRWRAGRKALLVARSTI